MRRATRSKMAKSSGTFPRSTMSACTRPDSSAMSRAWTTSVSSPVASSSDPTSTCDAPTSWPMRMTVASLNAAAGGTCRRSKAWRRSSRVMALAPSAFRSSARITADASASQKMRLSRVTFSNGITRMRDGEGVCAAAEFTKRKATTKTRRHELFTLVIRSAVQERHRQQAGWLAGAAARDDVGLRAEAKEREQPRERRSVEAAERVLHRRADAAEDRRADIDARRPFSQPYDRAAAPIAAAHQAPRHPEEHPRAHPHRHRFDASALQRRHRRHRPFGGVFARARRDDLVRVTFLPEESEHGVQRRQSDGAFAQPLGVQPVLIKPQAGWENVGDALMEAGDEDATDAGFAHVSVW